MKNLLQKILLIILIIILCTLIYSKYILKNKFITFGKYGFLIVLTGSMEPEIKTGEFLIIKKCLDYNVGDIITYEDGDWLTTHRVVSENNYEIITKGDANNERDLKIMKNKVLGKVIYNSEFLGFFIINYLKIIIIGLIVVIIFVNVIYILKDVNKEVDSEKEREKRKL